MAEKANKTCVMVYLLRMAITDGHLSREEKDLIFQYGESFGFSLQEIQGHIVDALDDNMPTLPNSKEEKREIFLEIVKLASCDGIDPEEVEYMHQISSDFELVKADVDEILNSF